MLWVLSRSVLRTCSGHAQDMLRSCVQLFATPWTVANQDLLSMGFPRQEYWSGLPFPLPKAMVWMDI